MAIRNAQILTIRPFGVSDDPEASDAFDGAMLALQNLAPNPYSSRSLVGRTGQMQLSSFAGFTTPGVPSALMIVGGLAWGFVPTGRYAGKDEPFCYDMLNGVFITINNVTNANTPVTQPSSGDWTPPTMAVVGRRILLTHPGYDGVSSFVGWIDVSSFASTPATGTTHSSTLVDALSTNPIIAGWQPGMKIAGTGIPANTYIVSLTATSLVLSQAATSSGAGVALTVTGGTPAAPLYGAGNSNTNAFAAVPTCVAQFGGRAWWGMQNYALYSDTLNGTQITLASQGLQLGDTTPVTAMAGLPLTSQVAGGTLQALIVFKGAQPFWQITGDPALQTLALNLVAGSVGTLAPNTICGTPQGLAYVAIDGLRLLGLDGVVRPVIGSNGEGVCQPFINALNPSRMAAAFAEETIRVTVQNAKAPSQGFQEWWFETKKSCWTGPHTCPSSLIRPYYGASIYPFVSVAVGMAGALFQSSTLPRNNATYMEYGAALNFVLQTPLLPDNQAMAMNALIQSTLSAQMPNGQALTVAVSDEGGNALDNVTLNGPSANASVWGGFNWGVGSWGYAFAPIQQYALPWHQPLVFKQASLRITGYCLAGFILDASRHQYTPLGYVVK